MRADLVHQWLNAIGRMEVATAVLQASVQAVVDLMVLGRKKHADGEDVVTIVPELIELGGVEARRAVVAASEEWERAMTSYRAVAVTILVESGMTVTEVAAMLGVTRQMASKLLRNGS